MLKNVNSLISSFFQSNSPNYQETVFVEGLIAEDKVDEPTAYAVLLVDLARADGKFEENEKRVISAALVKIFPNQECNPGVLLPKAERILDTFRPATSFVERIKEEYSKAERLALYNIIEDVIQADNVEEPIEIYLKNKFFTLLA